MKRFSPIDVGQFVQWVADAKAAGHLSRANFGVCMSSADTLTELESVRDAITEVLQAMETAADQCRLRIAAMKGSR